MSHVITNVSPQGVTTVVTHGDTTNVSPQCIMRRCHHNMSPQHVTTSVTTMCTTMCTTTSHHKMSPQHVTTVCRNKVSPRMCHHNVSPPMCPHNASPVACRRGRSSAVSATLSTPGRRPSRSAEWT